MEVKYNPRNFIMNGMTYIYQLMILNILFIVFSIPIITIGSATKAMTACTKDMVNGDLNHEIKTFFKYYKSDFKKTTISFMFLSLMYIIVALNFINADKIGWIFGVIQIPVFIQLLLVTSMINYILLEYDFGLKKTFKVAWVIGNRNIIRSIGFIGIAYLVFKLSLYTPFIILFFYIPILFLLQHVFCYKTIKDLRGDK